MPISRKAKREVSWILLFLSCLPLIYMLIWGDGGFLKLRESRQEAEKLRLDNLQLRQNYQNRLENIHRIRVDPSEIERIARERYNFARPGDIIVNLPE